MASPNSTRLLPSKEVEHENRPISNQRKEIEGLEAQLSLHRSQCDSALPANGTGIEILVKDFEALKVSKEQLSQELERRKMLITEMQKDIFELKNRTPLGAEDLDIQVRYLIRILGLASQERIYAKSNTLGEIAEHVDDLIMHYKWPYRNQERFDEMRAIATNLKEMGFPVEMHVLSFDKHEVTEREKEWAEKIQGK